ncbi:MAG: hypothetical protein RRZ73_05305 [Oscillospiraceae bacterium]
MKQPFIITIAALIIVTVSCFVLSYFIDVKSNKSIPPTQSHIVNEPLNPPKAPAVNTDFQFLIANYQGRIAVYEKNRTTPKKIFNVYLSTLPEYDKKQLEKGIPIANYEELVKRLEDYIS